MVVEYDTKPNCKYLSACYNKRDEVLLELLDHTIHKHLSYGTQCSDQKHVKQKLSVWAQEYEDIYNRNIH